MPGLDSASIRHALRTAREHGFRRVSVSEGEGRFTATLDEFESDSDPAGELPSSTSKGVPANLEIGSPCVGYLSDQPKLPNVGDSVESGQVVAAVLALGLANEVVASAAGKVEEVLAVSGQPLEFGQPILLISRSQP